MEMFQGKEMNKDIVEFSYRQCSPLKRAKLSESIKEILNIKTSSVNKSKNKILNYIIEALNATTLSISNTHKNRSKENIESLLLKFHKSDEYLNDYKNEVKPYKEISEKERKKISTLLKENSEIKKDNYKVMFESLFIVINELLYQKKKQRQSAIMSPKRSVLLTTPNSPRFVSRMMSKTTTIKKSKQVIKSNNTYICKTERNSAVCAKFKKSMIGRPKISNTYVNNYLKNNSKGNSPSRVLTQRTTHKKAISIGNRNNKKQIINESML